MHESETVQVYWQHVKRTKSLDQHLSMLCHTPSHTHNLGTQDRVLVVINGIALYPEVFRMMEIEDSYIAEVQKPGRDHQRKDTVGMKKNSREATSTIRESYLRLRYHLISWSSEAFKIRN